MVAVAVGNRCSRKAVECRRHRSVGHRPASRHPARARPEVPRRDRLGCGRKAAIAQLLSSTLALAHEQFGGYAVVERHSSRSAGFAFMLNPITEIDRKGLFGRQASARSATPTSTPTFPHLVELALPPGGFRSVFLEIDAFHRGRPSQYAAAGVDARPSNSLFDSASQTPPLRMHSATASVANA